MGDTGLGGFRSDRDKRWQNRSSRGSQPQPEVRTFPQVSAYSLTS